MVLAADVLVGAAQSPWGSDEMTGGLRVDSVQKHASALRRLGRGGCGCRG
jgi:hypothetical protein